jgi:hypothetical protein
MSECILWVGATIRDKKGNLYGYPSSHGKHYLAHREAWEMAHGRKIPKGKVVRHTCDVTLCVNPKHLLIGTQSQNMMDSVKRGRHGNSRISAIACRRGHARSAYNTQEYMRTRNGETHMERRCKACRRGDPPDIPLAIEKD